MSKYLIPALSFHHVPFTRYIQYSYAEQPSFLATPTPKSTPTQYFRTHVTHRLFLGPSVVTRDGPISLNPDVPTSVSLTRLHSLDSAKRAAHRFPQILLTHPLAHSATEEYYNRDTKQTSTIMPGFEPGSSAFLDVGVPVQPTSNTSHKTVQVQPCGWRK